MPQARLLPTSDVEPGVLSEPQQRQPALKQAAQDHGNSMGQVHGGLHAARLDRARVRTQAQLSFCQAALLSAKDQRSDPCRAGLMLIRDTHTHTDTQTHTEVGVLLSGVCEASLLGCTLLLWLRLLVLLWFKAEVHVVSVLGHNAEQQQHGSRQARAVTCTCCRLLLLLLWVVLLLCILLLLLLLQGGVQGCDGSGELLQHLCDAAVSVAGGTCPTREADTACTQHTHTHTHVGVGSSQRAVMAISLPG